MEPLIPCECINAFNSFKHFGLVASNSLKKLLTFNFLKDIIRILK